MYFRFWFHGRQQGATGKAYDQNYTCHAKGEAEAREKLAKLYEVYQLKLITRAFLVTLENGSTIATEMNATLEEATAYYLNAPGWRTTYDESGPLLKAVKVEQI